MLQCNWTRFRHEEHTSTVKKKKTTRRMREQPSASHQGHITSSFPFCLFAQIEQTMKSFRLFSPRLCRWLDKKMKQTMMIALLKKERTAIVRHSAFWIATYISVLAHFFFISTSLRLHLLNACLSANPVHKPTNKGCFFLKNDECNLNS